MERVNAPNLDLVPQPKPAQLSQFRFRDEALAALYPYVKMYVESTRYEIDKKVFEEFLGECVVSITRTHARAYVRGVN